MTSYQCRDSNYKDTKVPRTSYSYNGNSHTCKEGLYIETWSESSPAEALSQLIGQASAGVAQRPQIADRNSDMNIATVF